jgi:hypothetical protein
MVYVLFISRYTEQSGNKQIRQVSSKGFGSRTSGYPVIMLSQRFTVEVERGIP